MKKLLIIGPFPDPITGVSVSNNTILNSFSDTFEIDILDTAPSEKFSESVGKFSFIKIFRFFKVYLKFYKIFFIDIIYYTPGQTFFGILKYAPFIFIAKVMRTDLIIRIHGNFLGRQYKMLSGVKKKIFKFVLSLNTKGIVYSKSLRPNLTPFLPQNRVYTLSNFVDPTLESSSLPEKNFNHLKLLFLSNLMEEKGIIDLLDALILLTQRGLVFEAKLAGNIDPALQDVVDSKLKQLSQVTYLGVVRGLEKKELLLESNVFILPTYYQMEGQPISILEAMITGNVVITTPHAGIIDIFEDKKNGYYVSPNSAASIAETLEHVSRTPVHSKEISIYNHKNAHEQYTQQVFLPNFTNIIND